MAAFSILTEQEVKNRLPEHIDVDYSTYVKAQQLCRFIDKEFGEFWAKPMRVFIGNAKHPARKKRPYKDCKLSREEVEARLHSGITIDWSTYTCVRGKCRFIHPEYGEFWTRPYVVFRGCGGVNGRVDKMKQTSLQKYGVDNNMKRADLALKNAKSRSESFVVPDWRTKDNELICIGSWEVLVLKFLKDNNINFEWQNTIFNFPEFTYRPDLFLSDENKFIEIKGRMGDRDAIKIASVANLGHNIEVWDRDWLKSRGIICYNSKKNISNARAFIDTLKT